LFLGRLSRLDGEERTELLKPFLLAGRCRSSHRRGGRCGRPIQPEA
jgi:hypothetical protein